MYRYLTTGQIAQELKISNQTVRNYCESGVIKATRSASGHYRTEPVELERLKGLESLPAVARATLSGNTTRSPAKRNPNELLAEPSIDAIESAEDAYRSERHLATDNHQLARMKVRKEGLELQDWFDARDEAHRNKQLEEERRQQEAYEKQIRLRQAQAAADERRRFEKKWLSHALVRKPWEGPPDFAVVVHPEDHTLERLVQDAIGRALTPWRREQQRLKAI